VDENLVRKKKERNVVTSGKMKRIRLQHLLAVSRGDTSSGMGSD
jgi:hypothetical protein